MKPQLEELLTSYGEVAVLWFEVPVYILPAPTWIAEEFVKHWPRLLVNAGWSPLPDQDRRITLDGLVAGVWHQRRSGKKIALFRCTQMVLYR